jgi:hypothetical protein
MIHEYEAVGGVRIGRGNRSTRRKSAPVPFCPPQIPHDLTWGNVALTLREFTVASRLSPSGLAQRYCFRWLEAARLPCNQAARLTARPASVCTRRFKPRLTEGTEFPFRTASTHFVAVWGVAQCGPVRRTGMRKEAVCSSETLVSVYLSVQYHSSEADKKDLHCESLKCQISA